MTASIATAAPGDGFSRRRLVVALLAVSLVLNLCFIAGAVWSRTHAPAPTTTSERLHRLAQSLDLNPQQQTAFDQYVAAMLARSERLRQGTEPLMDQAWAEIANPQPDQAKVLQLLDNAATQRHELQHEAVGATLSLLATFTPEQKAKFLAEEQKRRTMLRRRHLEESR